MSTQTMTGPELIDRDAKLVRILRLANVHNEDGDRLEDFTLQNWDRKDFASVSRTKLRQLMVAAYAAGRESR